VAIKNQLEFEDELIQLSQIPKELAVLPINDAVVFPLMMVPLLLNDPSLLRLADEALADQKIIGAFTQLNPTEGKPGPEDIYKIGTAVHIQKMIRFPNGEMRLMGQGLTRIRISEMTQAEPYMRARIESVEEIEEDSDLLKAYIKTVTNSFSKVIDESENLPEELKIIINNIKEGGRIADVIATNMNIDLERKQALLEEADVLKRFKLLSNYLSDELEVVRLGKKLQSDVKKEAG
jgi:ATP-dependent Lon protease